MVSGKQWYVCRQVVGYEYSPPAGKTNIYKHIVHVDNIWIITPLQIEKGGHGQLNKGAKFRTKCLVEDKHQRLTKKLPVVPPSLELR